MRTFKAVEHRLEFVRHLNGVDFYNDSKATSVDATLKALDAFPGGLWVILGGKDKGLDYTVLRAPLAAKAHAALLIGAAAAKIAAQLERRGAAGAGGNAGERRALRVRARATGRYRSAGAGLRQLRPIQELRASRPGFQKPRTATGAAQTNMAQRLKTDWTLFGTTIGMVAFGAVILYSASSVIAELKFGSSWHFVLRQGLWLVPSLLLMIFSAGSLAFVT